MARADVEYRMMQDVQRKPLASLNLPLGWLGEQLSEDPTTGESTYLVSVQPHWRLPSNECFQCGLEIFVLTGVIDFSDHQLRRGHHARVTPGAALGPASSDVGATFLAMMDGQVRRSAPVVAGGWQITDVLALPWQASPDFEGRTAEATPPGVFVKWIYEDAESGAYALIVRQMGGWSDPELEAHRCWEELLLLEGDYLMGVNGAVSAGCYIFRNGEIPHGPQASREGSIWFCRGNARIDFQYSGTAWAQPQIDGYLTTGPQLPREATISAPWGSWQLPEIQ